MVRLLLKNFVFLFLMGMAVVSCSNSSSSSNSTSSSSKEGFLREFYTECVFGYNPEADKILAENSSERLLKCLRDGYGYDCEDDNCYAIWLFRTGFQDSNSRSVDTTGVKEVVSLEDGCYLVRYFDMGWKGATRIKFVEENGKLVMDELFDERGVDSFTVSNGEYVTAEELQTK